MAIDKFENTINIELCKLLGFTVSNNYKSHETCSKTGYCAVEPPAMVYQCPKCPYNVTIVEKTAIPSVNFFKPENELNLLKVLIKLNLPVTIATLDDTYSIDNYPKFNNTLQEAVKTFLYRTTDSKKELFRQYVKGYKW